VTGVVRDITTLQPIPSARVLVEGTTFEDSTDIAGRYRIGDVPDNWYYVSARAAGYRGETLLTSVLPRRTSTCDFELEPLPPVPVDTPD
jgi:hypothetical protein